MRKKMRGPLFIIGLLFVIATTTVERAQNQPERTEQIFRVTVNYGRSVKRGVRAGHYNYVNPDVVSENFSSKETGTKEIFIHLVSFNKTVSANEALAELDKRGFRPANTQECMAFGEKHPDVQREFPIAFLGAVWRDFYGGRYCLCLAGDSVGRYLVVGWIDDDWKEMYHYRFAAVRK